MSKEEITTWAISLVTLAVLVAFEFLAIGRNPAYRKRELLRRTIGILTVLGVSGAHVYHVGGDLGEWAQVAVFFGVGGVVALVAQRWERSRKRRLVSGEGRKNGDQREWQGKTRESTGGH
jgi:hypothetical protein